MALYIAWTTAVVATSRFTGGRSGSPDGSGRSSSSGRGSGAWFDSATTFSAAQVRYELRSRWHAMAQYRWLDVDDGGTLTYKQGVTQHFTAAVTTAVTAAKLKQRMARPG